MSWLFSAFLLAMDLATSIRFWQRRAIYYPNNTHTHTQFWQFLLYLAYIHLLLISDDAETVDSTLIVNGTSSSQEKAEISGKFFVYVFYFQENQLHTHLPNNFY